MSSDTARVASAARYFHDIHNNKKLLPPLPPEIVPRDLDEAYAMQEALAALFAPERGPVAGYKIAVTTPVMQELMGIRHPCVGVIFAKLTHQSPAVVRCADYRRVAIECEIAIRIGVDLPADRRFDRASIAETVDAILPAIELIEDHEADYKKIEAKGLIANNAWNGGAVLGAPVTAWRDLDLLGITGRMLINGEEIGRGHGADVMGHPLESLAFVANTVAGRGRPLRRGMVVLTGSVVATQWPKRGDTVTVSFSGLGDASARFD